MCVRYGGTRAEGPKATQGRRGREGSRCVSASATRKATRSSAGSVFIDVACIPAGLAGCTQACPPGVVKKIAWQLTTCVDFVFETTTHMHVGMQ